MTSMEAPSLDRSTRVGGERTYAGRPIIALADGSPAPGAPRDLADTGVDPESLADLVLKCAHMMASYTTQAIAERTRLPIHIAAVLLDRLKSDKLIEILGPAANLDYRYAITQRGRERAVRLFEISGYVGPAPVSLAEYTSVLDDSLSALRRPTPVEVASALSPLSLPDDVIEIAGLAGSSGRSLFVFGPPGNGKTTLGHLIHQALPGSIWIPYAIAIENHMVRIFDPQTHQRDESEIAPTDGRRIDGRWVRIRRPFVVAAGELTLEDLELGYTVGSNCYEAPLHLKANGGTFLLDDFGRQRVEARRLLNRWVFPLENRFDYMTLRTGQKVEVPFRQLIIVCTNLAPEAVVDPAFLRRMGYRIHLESPTAERYREIFNRYAESCGLTVPDGVTDWLLARYGEEERPRRSCEPRDLIERVRDICRYEEMPFGLSQRALQLAWSGYFGTARGT